MGRRSSVDKNDIPAVEVLKEALLRQLDSGRQRSFELVEKDAASELDLSLAQRRYRIAGSKTTLLENRFEKARAELKSEGLIEYPRIGKVKLTQKGKAVLEERAGAGDAMGAAAGASGAAVGMPAPATTVVGAESAAPVQAPAVSTASEAVEVAEGSSASEAVEAAETSTASEAVEASGACEELGSLEAPEVSEACEPSAALGASGAFGGPGAGGAFAASRTSETSGEPGTFGVPEVSENSDRALLESAEVSLPAALSAPAKEPGGVSQKPKIAKAKRRGPLIALIVAAILVFSGVSRCSGEAQEERSATGGDAAQEASVQDAVAAGVLSFEVEAEDWPDASATVQVRVEGALADGTEVDDRYEAAVGTRYALPYGPGTYTISVAQGSLTCDGTTFKATAPVCRFEGTEDEVVTCVLTVDEEAVRSAREAEERAAEEAEERQRATEEAAAAAAAAAIAASTPVDPVVDEGVGGQESARTVYITETGERYHSDGCRHLSKSKIPIAYDEARAQGYTPCGTCHPG